MRLFRARLQAYISLVLLACVLTAGTVILLLPHGRVTKANFEKIQVGMSLEDVERLLGPPDGEGELRKKGDLDRIFQVWTSPEITIMVSADPARRVVGRGILEMGSLWERVWSWVMEYF